MKIISIPPKNDLLKNYIDCIHILQKEHHEKDADIIVFPHVNTGISFSKTAKLIKVNANYFKLKHNPNNRVLVYFNHNLSTPMRLNYEGFYYEITISFRPLGIYAFINNEVPVGNSVDCFTPFIPFPDFEDTAMKILSLNDEVEQIEYIESYWLSKLNTFEHAFLKEAVKEIQHPTFTVKEFTKKNNLTVKSFIFHFKKYLGRTPTQHKKILRFRHSIDKKYAMNRNKNFTQVALDAGYFDQSHFIKDYKNLIGEIPKEFFKNINDFLDTGVVHTQG